MEAKFRGLPYPPWLSCIVTKLQRHDQTIARNCTVVMVAVVRQGYVKIFKSQGGRILIASFYHVTTFYKSSLLGCRYGNDVQDTVPNCFQRIVRRYEVNLINLFTLLYACATHTYISFIFSIAIGKRLEGKVF